MSEKLFDCYFIATDSNNVTKVRFANDHDKRMQVLLRDKFIILSSDKFESKMSKEEILDEINENDLSEVEFEAYRQARKVLNKNKTSAEDVLNAIRDRARITQQDQVSV
jgi:serine/threonine protein phosphatase PrpC